jgi:hypothetical protein
MKNRIVYLALAIMLVLAMVPVLAPGVALAQTTWYVSTTGNNTTGDGSQGNPWRTIQYAVDQASGGDAIIVAAGQYDESVTIGKSLTLEGEQAGMDARERSGVPETIVDPGSGWVALYATEYATQVTIDGFTFKGRRGAVTIESPTSEFLNSIVYPVERVAGNPQGLVYIDGNATNVTVRQNDISPEDDDGLWPSGLNALRIAVTGAGSITVDNNLLRNASHYSATVRGAGLGVYASDPGATITVTNNEMRDNGSDGMFTYNSQFGTLAVSGNDIYNNDQVGVKIAPNVQASSIFINENNIYDNGTYGVANQGFVGVIDAVDNYWGHSAGPPDDADDAGGRETEEVPPCATVPNESKNETDVSPTTNGVQDDYDHCVDYCSWWLGPNGEEETVSTPDTPTGPSYGNTTDMLTYCTGGATSNLGHPVEYQFDWGDGTYSSWSSSTCEQNSWSTEDLYYVRARARCALHTDVISEWSEAKNVLIGDAPVSDDPPAPPTNLVATAFDDPRIDLTWEDNSNNELGFKIWRKNRELGVFHEIDEVGDSVTTYTDTDVVPGQQCWYMVKAWNYTQGPLGPEETFSDYSNVASAIVPSGGGCFVATAAYGSYLDTSVEALRAYRDTSLQSNPFGRGLVSAYYELSPPVAEFINDHTVCKSIVRAALVPAVHAGTTAVGTSTAVKTAVAGLMGLLTATVLLWVTRRTRRTTS